MKTLFFGDVCPKATKVSESFRECKTGELFSDVKDLIVDADFTAVNLECALTESEAAIRKFGPNLKAPKETARVLAEVGVTLCGLSNNHVFDFGKEGMKDTFEALSAAGLDYTGFGENYEDSRKNYYFEKDGERIAVVAVCEHEYTYALENRMGARPYDEYETMDDIRLAKQNADRVVVMYHGGKEYCRYPSPRLLRLSRAMIRSGADLVLCQHSHCIGCYEEYLGGHIVYGQGNFHFIWDRETDMWNTSLAVQYDTKKNEVEFIPVRAYENGVALAKGEDRERLLREFENRNSELKNGAWKQGWHEFCLSKKEQYVTYIEKAGRPESSEIDNAVFGHYLDCEAHTDVWRELFPTWNQTNCIDE